MNNLDKQNEVLRNFKKKELYQNSTLFHNIVQQLIKGRSPYDIIEELVEMSEINRDAFAQYMQRDTRPMVMSDGNIYKINYNDDVLNALMGNNKIKK